MGESKRRKQALGDDYGKSEPIASWLPFLTKQKAEQFVQITSTGAWIGIGVMVAFWIVVRFIGPSFGWWEVVQ
ncbi:DUF2839 domain-containing protein [Pseudanabaena sp. PCC 6802]|uniref:DUF2839 domain-containing protein n=1 Tax=Pseudanabaena sp. PCC 6802 TaxID=118173 RepID=UPI00034DC5A1|nr:DUF2839 domain-containing protein [Pseudanabaena sp. PCC 6802]